MGYSDAALILLQICSAAALVLFRYRGHTLPANVDEVYKVYHSVDSAPARIMLPAKLGTFSALGTDAATSDQLSESDVVPLCGSAVADEGEQGTISTTLPVWQLPDDNSGLDAFATTLVCAVPHCACAIVQTAPLPCTATVIAAESSMGSRRKSCLQATMQGFVSLQHIVLNLQAAAVLFMLVRWCKLAHALPGFYQAFTKPALTALAPLAERCIVLATVAVLAGFWIALLLGPEVEEYATMLNTVATSARESLVGAHAVRRRTRLVHFAPPVLHAVVCREPCAARLMARHAAMQNTMQVYGSCSLRGAKSAAL